MTTGNVNMQEQRAAGPRNRANAFTLLRRRYFANGADAAARYGIGFERITQHLWDLRRRHPLLPLRSIVHLDDLLFAIACIDEQTGAWHDLIEQYAPWLVRRLRRSTETSAAVLAVRQLFLELRRAEPGVSAEASLYDYAGLEPLRMWLAERLCDRLSAQEATKQPPRGVPMPR